MPPLAIDELCAALEAPLPSPAGGSAAAAVAAIAASLVAMVGRGSPGWPDGAAAAAAATGLRERLLALGGEDVEAVAGALAASRAARSETDRDSGELAQALTRATRVPLEIAGHAAEVAGLAARAVAEGKRPMRPDAEAAAALAETAGRVALAIVHTNLAAPGLPGDETDRLREAAAETGEMLERLAAAGGRA
jgi:formiminotetrahydrofolate cyclodeaminase